MSVPSNATESHFMTQHDSTSRRGMMTNAAANWLGFVATVAVTFFMSPLLVHELGDRDYGVWALVESVLAYLALFDLGIGAAVVRYVARFQETREDDELDRVFSTSLAIFAGLGLLALAITLALAFVWSRPLGVPEDVASAARWLLVLLGLNLAVGLPLGVYDSVLYALGRFPLRTAVQLSVLALRTATFLWILHRGGGLLEIGLAITFFGVLQHVILLSIVHRLVPKLRFSIRFVDRSTFHTIRGYSLWAFMAMVAGRISFSTDAIVISAFLTPEYITYFAIAARLIEYGKNAVQSATAVLTPTISRLDAKEDFEGIRRVLIAGSRCVVWFILPVQLGMMFFGYTFLSMWMGDRIAEQSFSPLLALSLTLTLATSQFISARLFYGVGLLHWFAWGTIAEALANLVISLALVRQFGITGVAIGTAIPNIVFNLALMVYVCRVAGVGLGSYLRGTFLSPLVAATVLLLTWYGWRNQFGTPSTWPSLALACSSGLFAYAVAGCFLEPELRKQLRRALARLRGEQFLDPPDASIAVY